MTYSYLAIDFGMTNIDLVAANDADSLMMKRISNPGTAILDQLQSLMARFQGLLAADVLVGVTGGRYRDLPDRLDGVRLQKIDEMCAVGFGGLAAAKLDEALVVSAGTGTAMVHASRNGCRHVTGSAVGGGTLLGLAKMLLGTHDPLEIDHLAMDGDAAGVDVMLSEAVGGKIGQLPAEANAVNLGKLAVETSAPSHKDLAAGLVRLVAQVIGVIAINAARAEGLGDTVLIGHLMDLESIRREIALVSRFYDWPFIVPENPGFGTAMGVLAGLKS